ncbi:MAG: hypothetical protein J6V18_05205 [Bacteroidales bacterium]|nr:hypothetical protein [Bacteroidales bacterium]
MLNLKFWNMRFERRFTYCLFALLAMFLLSQSVSDVRMQRISKSSYGISISVLSDAKQQKNHLNEKESENKNRTEIALSETRHLVFQQNEDFNYSSVSDFEYRYSCNLNIRLNNQKADLLLRKDLSQLQVLLI